VTSPKSTGGPAYPATFDSLIDPVALSKALRKLWADYASWLRFYFVSAADELPDQAATLERLLQSQADIGNAFEPFFGDAISRQLTELLQQRIHLAVNFLDAVKAEDTEAMGRHREAWRACSERLADLLSSLNPDHWPVQAMRASLRQLLDLTSVEIIARVHRDYPVDMGAYEQIHTLVLNLADLLTDGLIERFPVRFPAGSAQASG